MSADPRIVIAAQLDAKVLAHITSQIGKFAPTKHAMADLFDTSVARIGHSIDRLRARGLIQSSGTGMAIQFHVTGKGDTLKRIGRGETPAPRFADGDVRGLSPDDIENRRVVRSTCFRCGVRSDHGCRHMQKDAPSVSAEGISHHRAGSHNSTEFGEGWSDTASNMLARA